MMRLALIGLWLVALLAACGESGLSLSEYADEADRLVNQVDGRLDAEAAAHFAQEPTVEGTRRYLSVRVDEYAEFLEGLENLDPPEEAQSLHEAFVEIVSGLLVAEEARADRAAAIDSVDEIDHVWTGAESGAVLALEQKAIALCNAAQSQFDATEDREPFTGNYWVPAELKDIVQVALDCPPLD